MGFETEAILFWGIAFEELGPPWKDGTGPISDEIWRSRLAERSKAQDVPLSAFSDITLELHGDWEHCATFIAVSSTIKRTDFRESLAVDPSHMKPPDEPQQIAIQKFCEVMAIPWKEPSWHLTVMTV